MGTVLLASMIIFAAQIDGQTLSGVPTCSDCRIRFDTVVTVGGASAGSASVTQYATVAVDHYGRVLVASGVVAPEISVFDSTGSFERTIGRGGDGPGEYRFITHLDVSENFLHVFDAGRGRTLLDEDFDVVRTDQFQGQVYSSAVPSGDELLLAAVVPSADGVGHPYHRLGPDGDISSFGYDGSVFAGGHPVRVVAASGNVMWVAEQESNALTRLMLDGELSTHELRVARRVDWFDRENPSTPSWPRSLVRAVRLDEQGLWVLGHVPDPKWTERYTESVPIPDDPPSEIFDGWLELLDPTDGSTFASVRLDGLLMGFAGGTGWVVSYREDASGYPYIDLLIPTIERPPKPYERPPKP